MTAAVREQIAHEPAAKGVEAGPALLEALGRSAWAPVEQEESSRVGHLSVSWRPKYGVEDLGEYQDFCSICRNVEVFLLKEHSQTPRVLIQHVLSIPTGVGTVLAHNAVCRGCKSWWWIEGAAPLLELKSETLRSCGPRLELWVENISSPVYNAGDRA